ncbi:MAG: hypothetical protein AAGB15_01485 [Pseudomonadota bacterium]
MTARLLLLATLFVTSLGLAACGGRAGEPVGTDVIDESYTLAGGKYDSGGEIVVAVAPRNIGGTLALCGARIQSRDVSSIRSTDDTVLLGSSVQVNGATVLRDLRNFVRHPLEENMNGKSSRCLATDRAWSDQQMTLNVTLPRHRDRTSRSRQVEFIPGEVPQLIGPPPSTAPDPEPAPKPGQWQVAK